jgi:hypothetical protein
MSVDDPVVKRRARTRIARRRGALSGLFLVLLGAWGALIPFIGPYFNYAYTPDAEWRWTSSRGWLEVLPGVAAVLGGLLVLASSSRVIAVLGAWLAAAAGTWFTIGTSLVPILHTGDIGIPASTTAGVRASEDLGFFYGLGAVIVFVAAAAFGRLSVRSLADIHFAQRTVADETEEARARSQWTQARDNRPQVTPQRPDGVRAEHASSRPTGPLHSEQTTEDASAQNGAATAPARPPE